MKNNFSRIQYLLKFTHEYRVNIPNLVYDYNLSDNDHYNSEFLQYLTDRITETLCNTGAFKTLKDHIFKKEFYHSDSQFVLDILSQRIGLLNKLSLQKSDKITNLDNKKEDLYYKIYEELSSFYGNGRNLKFTEFSEGETSIEEYCNNIAIEYEDKIAHSEYFGVFLANSHQYIHSKSRLISFINPLINEINDLTGKIKFLETHLDEIDQERSNLLIIKEKYEDKKKFDELNERNHLADTGVTYTDIVVKPAKTPEWEKARTPYNITKMSDEEAGDIFGYSGEEMANKEWGAGSSRDEVQVPETPLVAVNPPSQNEVRQGSAMPREINFPSSLSKTYVHEELSPEPDIKNDDKELSPESSAILQQLNASLDESSSSYAENNPEKDERAAAERRINQNLFPNGVVTIYSLGRRKVNEDGSMPGFPSPVEGQESHSLTRSPVDGRYPQMSQSQSPGGSPFRNSPASAPHVKVRLGYCPS